MEFHPLKTRAGCWGRQAAWAHLGSVDYPDPLSQVQEGIATGKELGLFVSGGSNFVFQ